MPPSDAKRGCFVPYVPYTQSVHCIHGIYGIYGSSLRCDFHVATAQAIPTFAGTHRHGRALGDALLQCSGRYALLRFEGLMNQHTHAAGPVSAIGPHSAATLPAPTLRRRTLLPDSAAKLPAPTPASLTATTEQVAQTVWWPHNSGRSQLSPTPSRPPARSQTRD
eukprot:170419-Chlamydomonas_euryale.AAC.2